MKRTIILAALALAVALGAALAPRPAPAANDDVYKCVADCINQWGTDKQTMCQRRCYTAGMGQQKPVGNCMSTYKACLSQCATDKACRRACKAKLMNCS